MNLSSLETIAKNVRSCIKCELCKNRINAVPGKGNPKADLFFVGEAPGKTEDELGEPFVGAAGKKLSFALEQAGLSRDDVYITNVVKCRPPQNRTPTLDEEQSCAPYLNAEISLIRPKIICIMGNTAFKAILGGGNIIKERGKFIKKGDNLYFLTIHPAAAIYNQELSATFIDDIKKLGNELSKLKVSR